MQGVQRIKNVMYQNNMGNYNNMSFRVGFEPLFQTGIGRVYCNSCSSRYASANAAATRSDKYLKTPTLL